MKIKKVFAGVIAFILIGFILFFANAFVGNPISKMMVNKAAKQHVDQNYSNLNLEIEKAGFNFKDGNYYVHAKSRTSIDTHFSLDFSGTGKLVYDSYEGNVLSKFNTWERIDKEYRNLADTVLENDFPYESDIAYGEIFMEEDQYSELEIDKYYDIKELGREKGHLILYITSNKVNKEALASNLLEIKGLFDKKKIPFYSINFILQGPLEDENKGREEVMINNFLSSDIYEDGLQERVNENIDKTRKHYEEMDKKMEDEINDR